MPPIEPKLAAEVWKVAGSVEWTVDDWKDFYQSLTEFFARVSARHAKQKLDGFKKSAAE